MDPADLEVVEGDLELFAAEGVVSSENAWSPKDRGSGRLG